MHRCASVAHSGGLPHVGGDLGQGSLVVCGPSRVSAPQRQLVLPLPNQGPGRGQQQVESSPQHKSCTSFGLPSLGTSAGAQLLLGSSRPQAHTSMHLDRSWSVPV